MQRNSRIKGAHLVLVNTAAKDETGNHCPFLKPAADAAGRPVVLFKDE